MLSQSRHQIQEDYKVQINKSIFKQKQKNQFSTNSKFLSKYQTNQKEDKTTTDEQTIIRTLSLIPKCIKQEIVYRLASNIQLPRNADTPYQLGCLNIDLYSYNYKPIRVDRFKDVITFTLESIDRPFIDYETICNMLSQRNEKLKECFCNLHKKKLNKEEYLIINQLQLQEFEQSIAIPFTGYVSKIYQDKIVTQQRMVSSQYLACLGVNEDMITHHVMTTGFMPLPFYFDDACQGSQYLSRFFELNIKQMEKVEMIITNYQGNKFPGIVHPKCYYQYSEEENCYYEYLFFLLECDKRWQSKVKIQENYLDYFNLKQIQSSVAVPNIKSEIQNTCGYKLIK